MWVPLRPSPLHTFSPKIIVYFMCVCVCVCVCVWLSGCENQTEVEGWRGREGRARHHALTDPRVLVSSALGALVPHPLCPLVLHPLRRPLHLVRKETLLCCWRAKRAIPRLWRRWPRPAPTSTSRTRYRECAGHKNVCASRPPPQPYTLHTTHYTLTLNLES